MERTIINAQTGSVKVYTLTPDELAALEAERQTPESLEVQWGKIRALRDAKLRETDWTELPDAPTSDAHSKRAYRQALRDITNQPDPYNIVWPEDN